ncbi:hypothetical protein [Moraxella lacunata]|uniref:hypothetical protein n=1 Tax=Moraxella lacunata TaxID=477 RepID=UPI003EE0BC84
MPTFCICYEKCLFKKAGESPVFQGKMQYGRVRNTHLLSGKSYWCVIRTLLSLVYFDVK